jgi:hypothetical protein
MAYVHNPLVAWLLSHAYGQGGTVAVPVAEPASQPAMAIGEFPPGIGEMLDHLAPRYGSWRAGAAEVEWCFLVGGPGNGKSEALRSLARRLGVTLPGRVPGQPVPRVIPVGWPAQTCALPTGLRVAFVNDASIPRPSPSGGGSTPGSLFLDVADALSAANPTALFVNVNRGILVEELGSLSQLDLISAPPQQKLAAGIIQWLSGPPRDGNTQHSGITTVLRPAATTPHYGQFKVDLSAVGKNGAVVCHVVFLDVLSLLEPRPGEAGAAIDFSTAPPSVGRYQTLGRLVSSDVSRDNTLAGGVLTSYVEPSRWQDGGCKDPATGELCQAHALCPLAQNAAWLQAASLRQRALDALRAAEIAAGRRLTYRDLLGHISLALIGPPQQAWLSGTHPCSWIAHRHERATGGSKGATVELASLRIHVNLFPTAGFAPDKRIAEHKLSEETVFGTILGQLWPAGEAARPKAFERAFADVDPARDAETWNGLRKRVLDAVESLDVSNASSQVSTIPEIPPAVICEIDRMLDEVVRGEIASELPRGSRAAVARVRTLRRWRSAMLLRQVGLALGRLRFSSALEAWLAEQENALNERPRLRLGDGINNLILSSSGGGKVFLAPFRPRTYCLTGELPGNTLLVSVNVNELDVLMIPHGDTLAAEVQVRRRQDAPQSLATLTIDLAVAREALLHSEGRSDSFTEIGDTAFARIERARASLIGRDRLMQVQPSYVDERSRMLQLSANPTQQAPVRVQFL